MTVRCGNSSVAEKKGCPRDMGKKALQHQNKTPPRGQTNVCSPLIRQEAAGRSVLNHQTEELVLPSDGEAFKYQWSSIQYCSSVAHCRMNLNFSCPN